MTDEYKGKNGNKHKRFVGADFSRRGRPAKAGAYKSMTCRLFAFSRGLDGAIDFGAMAGNDRIQLLLDLAEDPRRIDTGEIAVDMLVDDFDEGEELRQ